MEALEPIPVYLLVSFSETFYLKHPHESSVAYARTWEIQSKQQNSKDC